MLRLPRHEDALCALKQVSISSEVQVGVSYNLGRILGGGATGVAFLAIRDAPDGQTPVVVKILKPELVRQSDDRASLIVQKEAVALGRLNEHVPPSPFVVRLIDTGSVPVMYGDRAIGLPWVAIEYVHGGAEGTTLEDRVLYSVQHTRAAFDPDRAARAIECLASGLTAIQEVGVVHRDVKPGNVLCCGFGQEEIFKIADFGIAQPSGVATFGGIAVGTPGYAPPEQLTLSGIGPWSDVFAMAAVIYFMLTGEEYFAVETARECVAAVQSPKRRRLADAAALSADLRDQPSACATIDAALARATAAVAEHRPQNASMLAAMIVPALRIESSGPSSVGLRLQRVQEESTHVSGWTWTPRYYPRPNDVVIRSVAWSGDGRCMAVTNQGLAFWNGVTWQPVPPRGLSQPEQLQFVHPMGPGVWMVGGNGSSIAVYTAEGVSKTFPGPDSSVRFIGASGDVNELAVFVGVRAEGPPLLCGLAAGHWVKPASLTKAASVSSLSRLDREHWIITGRTLAGDGFGALYSPLMWEVQRIDTPPARAYLACATQPELGVGVIVGANGQTVRVERQSTHPTVVEGSPDISAVALDVAGRGWAGCTGGIWLQQPSMPSQWRCAWSDPQWRVPIVSMFADIGMVIAMTAHGGILEGRFEMGR